MPDNIETINGRASFAAASTIKVWHGKGQTIEGASFTPERAAVAVPTAFMVVDAESHFLSDGRFTGRTAVRQGDRHIIADVGPTQTFLQASDGIDALARCCPGEVRLQAVGVLGEGERVFFQTPPVREILFPNSSKRWEARLSWVNCHDGTEAAVLLATTVDTVCANTVGRAIIEADQAGTSKRVSHRKHAKAHLSRAAESLAAHLDSMTILADAAQVALDTPLTRDEELTIVKGLWKSDSKQAETVRSRVLMLSTGEGLTGAAEHNPGSAYGLYAAITQYLDTEAPRRLTAAEKADASVASIGTYLRSNLGLDRGLNTLRQQATQVLLGV